MSIIKFDYFGKEIKAIQLDDIQLWSGKDVCHALNINDHKRALGTVWDEYKYRGDQCPLHLKIPAQSILLNESGIYQLIFKSRKDEAIKFQKWVFEEVLPKLRKQGIEETKPKQLPFNELNLAFRIKSWVDLCVDNNRFNIETPVLNTINNKTKTRRLDFVQNNGKNIIAYELKLNEVTLTDIASTIGEKGYYNLCETVFKRPIKFIFLSNSGISEAAKTLLNTMPNISYQSVNDLCVDKYLKGINKKWVHSKWYLDKALLSNDFNRLFNDRFINKVKLINLSDVS